jgi:hypothetical protein
MPAQSKSHADSIGRSATTAGHKKPADSHTGQGTIFGGRRHEPPAPTTTSRPVPNRQQSYHTPYVEMLLNLDTIPRLHNILAAFLGWLLLAGFVVFPGTFTSIQESLSNDQGLQGNATASTILNGVKNIPLVVVAAICCGVGALGMIWLSVLWRDNYVWLLNRLYLPGFMNGFAGLISTLVSVYTQQHGDWSITAKTTAIAEGACMAVCGILFVVYNNLLLEKVKKRHGRDMEQRIGSRVSDEGFLDKVERKAKEPALEPGSVV